MTHTYRDPDVVGYRLFGPFHVFSLLFIPILVVGSFALGWIPYTKGAALLTTLGTAVLFAHQYFAYRFLYYGTCAEIRLSDDGTCELETKRRVIRLHVNQIQSVEFSPEGEERSEFYTICFEGGKLRVGKRMADFSDFLSRVKTTNPAVDLTTFPAQTWSGLGGQESEKPGPIIRLLQRAPFPLIVIVLLVYLASQTLDK